MIRDSSDKLIAPGLASSMAALQHHRGSTVEILNLFTKAIPILKKYLNVSEDVHVRVCPIKKTSLSGRYWNVSKVIEVSCRLRPEYALETLCHEFVHAEQFNEGRMNIEIVNGKWVNYWNGFVYRDAKNYNEYLNLPWEREAFVRQEILSSLVMETLKKEL